MKISLIEFLPYDDRYSAPVGISRTHLKKTVYRYMPENKQLEPQKFWWFVHWDVCFLFQGAKISSGSSQQFSRVLNSVSSLSSFSNLTHGQQQKLLQNMVVEIECVNSKVSMLSPDS